MKNKVAILAVSLAAAAPAHAGLVAGWTFGSNSAKDPVPASGSDGSYLNSSFDGTGGAVPALDVTFGSGVSENFNSGILTLTVTGNGGASINGIQASSFVLTFDPKDGVTSLGVIHLTYSAKAFTGTTDVSWRYKVDSTLGGSATWFGLGTDAVGSAGFATYDTDDIPNVTIGSGQTLFAEAQFSGVEQSPGSGNPRTSAISFDTINAIPEPTNLALSAFGIGAIGVAAGRRLLFRKTVQAA